MNISNARKATARRSRKYWPKARNGFRRWLASIKGNEATFYMTYPNNVEWNAKIFKGVIVSAGGDSVVIQDEATGRQFLLLYRNLDYVTVDIIFD
ncbi:spore coat protein GerQ [Paenibacillus sp. MMS18-CY102]|uniref:spore coat protein GerQ n=1 Tax=Paenibacillus sp. MMS18-CY102 TaxID=2682849 RepID=UPI00301491C3